MPARRLLMEEDPRGFTTQARARTVPPGGGAGVRRSAWGRSIAICRGRRNVGSAGRCRTDLDDAALEGSDCFPRAAPVHDRIRPDCAYIHRELKARQRPRCSCCGRSTRKSIRTATAAPSSARSTGNGRGGCGRRCGRCTAPARRRSSTIPASGRAWSTGARVSSGRVELFVAVLGASSLTYAAATETQQLPDWIDAHIRMVEYFGGATTLWVPDQLKSAITRPCRYEPGVNRTYEDLATHYGAVVVPARPRKPRDKAAVENCVLIAQRWILARLRDQTFFELGPLNAAIRVLLDELNDRPMKKLGVSRRALYEQVDRPALRSLPTARYVLAHWKLLPRQHRLPRRGPSATSIACRSSWSARQVEVRYTTNTVVRSSIAASD